MSKLSTHFLAWAARHRLLLILLLALGLRLLLWSQPLHQLANDEIEYVTVARDLLAGRGWQFYEHYHWLRAPLYPLFLAGSLWLVGGDLQRATLPNLALSVATVYLIYRLAGTLAGRRAALLAALFAALLWTYATFASLYMAETLFTFLFTAGLLCLASPREQPSNPWRLAGAGVLFGLATLTRSITLLFLPLVVLWLLIRRPTTDDRRPTTDQSSRFTFHGSWFSVLGSRLFVLCSLFFVLGALLMIAPWTIRNTLAYGRPILVETGLSYNLWAFNEPREDPDTIFETLERIPNPADRSDYATARGLERLREDPAILARKLRPNWVYLWRVKPIEDRFIQESYYADVGLPLFGAALLFDDALYLLIALAGIAGLALHRPRDKVTRRQGDKVTKSSEEITLSPLHPVTVSGPSVVGDARWLCILWLLYAIATMLLTHAEARYRHFLFPVLIPYAAWALTQITRSPAHPLTRSPAHPLTRSPAHIAVVVLWALVLWVALPAYPWSWAGGHIARGWHVMAGDIAWAAGARGWALGAYERAIAAQETPDGWLRLGDAVRASGDQDRALADYRVALRLSPSYIPASARIGDLLRARGDLPAARAAFAGSYMDPQQVAVWSWRELRPAPQAFVDVGDGLDFGYVSGVYPAEQLQGATARWTTGRALLRLRGEDGAPGQLVLVRLRLAASHPGDGPVSAHVCAENRCLPLTVGPAWRTYILPFAMPPGEQILVEVRSDTFDAPDGRRLGLLIDSAGVTSLPRTENPEPRTRDRR